MNHEHVNLEFDSNEYARPNQKWVCGWSADGLACPSGPTEAGRCRAVCTPYQRNGRYYCANASFMEGACDLGPAEDGSCCATPPQCTPIKKGRTYTCGRGVCTDGPNPDGSCCQPFTPCRPVRSVFSRRKIFSLFAFVGALGLAVLMVAGPWQKEFIKPGKLTSHHSSVVGQCSSCHALVNDTVHEWVARPFGGGTQASQTTLCMRCHTELGNFPTLPHTADSHGLAKLTAAMTTSNSLSHPLSVLWWSDVVYQAPQELTCSACHQEHRGEDFDIKRLTDQQCQKCHAKTFHSFQHNHPEFSAYPFKRRTRIYFDHVSHYNVHFADSASRSDLNTHSAVERLAQRPTQESCKVCHTPDSSGRYMTVRTYQDSCAACHQYQIENTVSPGLAVFSLPVVDPDYVGERFWNQATLVRGTQQLQASGWLPPIMRLLLSSDSEFAELDGQLRAIDLSDLQNQEEGRQAQVNRFIQIIKHQLDTMDSTGPREIEQALARSLGQIVSDEEITQLAKLLEYDWLISAKNQLRSSLPTDPIVLQVTAIRSLPSEMLALLSSVEAFSDLYETVNAVDLSQMDGIDSQQRDAAIRLANLVRNQFDEIKQGGPSEIEDRLTKTRGDDVPSEEIKQQAAELSSKWIDLVKDDFNAMLADQSKTPITQDDFDRGWYLRYEDLSLRYRPSGHADPILKSWIDVSARLGGDPQAPIPIRDVFLELSDPAGVGRCLKCHTLDRRSDGPGFSVNWHPYQIPQDDRPFTHFSHQPHLTMLKENACRECHQLQGPGESDLDWSPFRQEFIDSDGRVQIGATRFHPNFTPISRSNCTSCHSPGRVSQSCTTCHNYHVNTFAR